MSAYQQFKTNNTAEAEGIVLDYGTFYLRVGRAGGANKKFTRVMKKVFDPHRRAIQTETISDAKVKSLMVEAYAEGLVYAWGYKHKVEDKSFIDGKMLDEEGKEMEFSTKNVIKLFTDLPDLFADVQEQAGKISLFRDYINEEDGKN